MMIITPLDMLFKKFSELWELKKKEKGVFMVYIYGITALILIIPAYFLCSWVIDLDLFNLNLQSLRYFLAVTMPGWCFYFIGGAVVLKLVRKHTDKKGGVFNNPRSETDQD